jgi:site-specific DNA-methyltransferase (adenine-specific)
MSAPTLFFDGRVTLHAGDCLAVVKTLPDNSIDACVCDPPYALVSIGKRFGADGAAPCKPGATGVYQRASAGFMGKKWDTGETAFAVELWAEIWRVLKPGGHVVAFGGTRSYHRLACAIEDAGFEIRDQIGWCYGSGFPKSHDVSKAIDKALGAERAVVRLPALQARNQKATGGGRDGTEGAARPFIEAAQARGYHETVSDEAVSWQGWGTALKPAWEPICLARKPLSEKTVAANALRWGTGAINVDGCRVEWASAAERSEVNARSGPNSRFVPEGGERRIFSPHVGRLRAVDDLTHAKGRWPANVAHDGSAEVLAAFPDSDGAQGVVSGGEASETGQNGIYSRFARIPSPPLRNDSGSAARFFYSAKADSDDRLGSKHPTVKPVALMQWLVRLVTPPGGTILDPFAGTGTTGEAAWREGFSAVLIEREPEYCADVGRRMALAIEGKETRKREAAKARNADKPQDCGPLFAGGDARATGAPRGGGRQIYGVFADEHGRRTAEPSARSSSSGDGG